jgi:hypothetical protein
LTIFIGCILLVPFGCLEQDKESQGPKTSMAQPVPDQQIEEPVAAGTEAPQEPDIPEVAEEPVAADSEPIPADNEPELSAGSPKIVFENVTHDFGDISPGSKNMCEFKFKNAGDALLRIGKIQSTCGCTVPELNKKEYAPGESGAIKATFHAGRGVGPVTKRLHVPNNDKQNSKVALTIKANIVMKVSYEPRRIKLMLEKENAGCPNITLKSTDGRAFAVKSFTASGSCITAAFDPSKQATEFVLEPKVDIQKLKGYSGSAGSIKIGLTHPGATIVTISFTVVPEFQINPNALFLRNVQAGKTEKREAWVINNYGRDFEIESIGSRKGDIRIVSRQKVDKRYKLELEITPPATEEKSRVFTDYLSVKIKDGPSLTMRCRGLYAAETPKR